MVTNGKVNILIVEDEPAISMDIANHIEKLGYIVAGIAYNLDTALLNFKENTPDLILMDINLGKNSPDGIETTNQIKKLKDIPVIYITSLDDDETINRAIKSEPSGYITKSRMKFDLKATIKLALFQSKNTRAEIDENLIHLGYDYYFDSPNLKLFYKTEPIKISPIEGKFIDILHNAKGTYVHFLDIEDTLWPDKVNVQNLKNLVYRLRAKVNFLFIKTSEKKDAYCLKG